MYNYIEENKNREEDFSWNEWFNFLNSKPKTFIPNSRYKRFKHLNAIYNIYFETAILSNKDKQIQ